jgi:hypothetical protein
VPALPVAVNVIGEPVRPVDVAVSVFAPAVVPSVQLVTVAIPLAFVVAEPPITDPVPDATKITLTPLTGLLLASFTITLGAVATAVPTVADCASPPLIAICDAAPAVTVTVAGLPLIAVPPIVTPIVGEPTVAGAVYVAVHTPLTQVKLPIEPALGVATNTADVAPVMMLPNPSLTVTVTVDVPLGPTLAGLADSVDVVALAAAALTTTLRRLPPAALIVPSVVATTAVSVFTSTIEAVATPLVNVTLVVLPKFVADTVGFVLFGATAAPLNVKLFEPVYVVAVLPFASCAVTVIVCATPAVCVPAPVITS